MGRLPSAVIIGKDIPSRVVSGGRIITVLYADNNFMVFDKPAGILVIPAPGDDRRTLVDIVNQQYGLSQEGKLYPCHRLDRETSGAIIFAKGKHSQQLMMNLFHQRTVSKSYIAFVHGRLSLGHREMRSRIRDFEQKKFHQNGEAKLSLTYYKVVEQRRYFSIVEVTPVTGRTNQIRIQFSEIGHPLVGERKYAIARDYPIKFRRVALHACALEWIHPVLRNKISVSCPLPKDMEEFIERNRD